MCVKKFRRESPPSFYLDSLEGKLKEEKLVEADDSSRRRQARITGAAPGPPTPRTR